MNPVLLSPKHAAERLSLTPSGLKWLELQGKIQPTRDSAGHRSYDPSAIAKLAAARAARTNGPK